MNSVWIWLLVIGSLCLISMFFSTIAAALHTFSILRLQEAFRARGRECLADAFARNAEMFGVVCAFYRLALNLAIVAILLAWFACGNGWHVTPWEVVFAFVIALLIVSIFSIAIPQPLAKYAGERILANTFDLLRFSAIVAGPILLLVKLYDLFIRRLAGISASTAEGSQDEKEEEFLSVVEQGKMEGVVDAEEQEMIENVLDLRETTAEKIMTPRTDVVAVSADSDLQRVLDAIATGHSRIPVYEGTIDTIIGFIYAKDMLTE
ncbi:MAG: CNNM domain-containing protein, partial [Sedimentisphaerales bacterium]|nr:CNNM domain-containing protein [Sedimentisphaerales bacterium]